MDHPPNPVKEAVESVNSRELGLSASYPSKSVKSESNVPNETIEALLKISLNMAQVLEWLTTPKAPIDMMRRHGRKNFMGQVWKNPIKPNIGLKGFKGYWRK